MIKSLGSMTQEICFLNKHNNNVMHWKEQKRFHKMELPLKGKPGCGNKRQNKFIHSDWITPVKLMKVSELLKMNHESVLLFCSFFIFYGPMLSHSHYGPELGVA